MKRFGLNVGSVISCMGFLAAMVLWVRSYQVADYLAYCLEKKELGVISAIGSIIVYRESALATFAWRPPFGIRYTAFATPPSISAFGPANISSVIWLGFGFIEGENGRYRASAIVVPYWAAAIVTGVLPITWILRWRRGRLGEKGFEVLGKTSGGQCSPS